MILSGPLESLFSILNALITQDFRKWIREELQVSFSEASVLPSAANIVVLTCSEEGQLNVAIQSINNQKWRGNEITCVVSLHTVLVHVMPFT